MYRISGGNFSFTGPSIVSQSLSRVIPYRLPPGSTQDLQHEGAFDGRMERVGRVGRNGRSRKVSFKFLHTLWVYRLCICLLVYEIKIVTNILMGLKISCQVGGRGQKFQNYSRYVTFLFVGVKVRF